MLTCDRSEWIACEDFLPLDFKNPHVEWVNGKVIALAPISGDRWGRFPQPGVTEALDQARLAVFQTAAVGAVDHPDVGADLRQELVRLAS